MKNIAAAPPHSAAPVAARHAAIDILLEQTTTSQPVTKTMHSTFSWTQPLLRGLRVSLCLLALSISACSMPSMNAESDPLYSRPHPKDNPAPKQAFKVIITIKDAPGSFEYIRGIVDYNAYYTHEPTGKRQCRYTTSKSMGTTGAVDEARFFDLKKVGEDYYEGLIYADQILDEDYFGQGICRWELTEVRARLKATGDEQETRFAPYLLTDQQPIPKHLSVPNYFWKGSYPANSRIPDFSDIGEHDVKRFNRNPDELFVINLAIEAVTP